MSKTVMSVTVPVPGCICGRYPDSDYCPVCNNSTATARYGPPASRVRLMHPDEPLADPVGAGFEPGDLYGPEER